MDPLDATINRLIYENRRARLFAAGLSTASYRTGKPRQRTWEHLDHLTPEKKRERKLAQKRAASRKARAKQ